MNLQRCRTCGADVRVRAGRFINHEGVGPIRCIGSGDAASATVSPDPDAPSANPSARAPKISERSLHLLRELAAGRDRIFAADARPPGAQALMQRGYMVRRGEQRAEITPSGRAFIAGYDLAYEQIATTLNKAG